jgi:hypothetical protein
MNTGYVVTLDHPPAIDGIERAGQKAVDDEWDWLSVPYETRSAVLYEGTSEEQIIEFVYGESTWQNEIEEDVVTVTSNDTITDRVKRRTIRERAEWLLIPEAGIGVVSDPAANFYIEQTTTATTLKSRDIDVRKLTTALDADAWGVGFAGRLVQEGANKGAVYGDRVEADPDLGEQLETVPLSQIGFEHSFYGEFLKGYVAKSGYVAAYGDNWTSADFVPWVVELVAPHLRDGSGTDEDQTDLEGFDDSGDSA